jgi:hypothetical protein
MPMQSIRLQERRIARAFATILQELCFKGKKKAKHLIKLQT